MFATLCGAHIWTPAQLCSDACWHHIHPVSIYDVWKWWMTAAGFSLKPCLSLQADFLVLLYCSICVENSVYSFFLCFHISGVLFVCFRLSCSLAQQGPELLTIFLSHPIKHLDNSYTPPDLAIFSQAQFIENFFSWMFLSMAILLIILKMFLLPVSWGKTINCSQMVLGWNSIHHISRRIHLRICIWIITYTQVTWNKLIPQF